MINDDDVDAAPLVDEPRLADGPRRFPLEPIMNGEEATVAGSPRSLGWHSPWASQSRPFEWATSEPQRLPVHTWWWTHWSPFDIDDGLPPFDDTEGLMLRSAGRMYVDDFWLFADDTLDQPVDATVMSGTDSRLKWHGVPAPFWEPKPPEPWWKRPRGVVGVMQLEKLKTLWRLRKKLRSLRHKSWFMVRPPSKGEEVPIIATQGQGGAPGYSAAYVRALLAYATAVQLQETTEKILNQPTEPTETEVADLEQGVKTLSESDA